MTTLTVVTFEPETIGIYIDGQIEKVGEKYMEGEKLMNIMESDITIDNTKTEHAHYEMWEGVPETIEKVKNTYGLK